MKIRTVCHATILLALVLSFAGCGNKNKAEAIQDWKAKGKTEKIIKLLADPLQSVRLEAIQALAELQTKEALEPLAGLFEDPDKVVVHEAINAIVKIGGPEIEPYMLQAITMDTVPARVAGATALGGFKSAEAVDALIIALGDYQYEQVVLAAIAALGQVGDQKAVEPLITKLQERSYDIREACISALRQIGGEAAIKGIATRLGDISDPIREATVSALIDGGAVAAPYALEALRDKSHFARASAIAVLNGIGAVPETGSDLVWYRLAELTVEPKTEVDPAKAEVFASIEDSVTGLLEGVMHITPEIREYAFIALENVGEPAAEAAVAMAEEKASDEALAWFNERSEWSGAPSWRLDLWGAATALSPKFRILPVYVEMLREGGKQAKKLMTSEHFRPQREVIPFLLPQLAAVEVVEEDTARRKAKKTKPNLTLVIEHLVDADYRAIFPLVAALNASELRVATYSAQVLNTIGGARVEQMVVEEYMKQLDPGDEPEPDEQLAPEEGLESGEMAAVAATPEAEETTDAEESVVPRRNPGEELSGTPLHHAMLQFDIPALEPLLLKIRPIAAQAIRAVTRKHPRAKVENVPLDIVVDPARKVVPFRLSYNNDGVMNELKLIYRMNDDQDWILTTPIPDVLP